MWRRYGDVPFTVLVFGVFCIEVLGLGFLTWSFSRRLVGLVPHSEVEGVLVGAVALTSVALLLLTAYILVYHLVSVVAEQQAADRMAAWTERWVKAIYGEEPAPEPPLPPEAEEAGLNLRDLLTGEEGLQLADALQRSGVAASLLRRLESRRMTVRMEALDGLARARLPETLGPVTRYMAHPEPVVRLMAARAGARILAEWTAPERDEAGAAFAEALKNSELPVGTAGETLLLLERAAPVVLGWLLSLPETPAFLLRAALDAIGRLGLVEFAYDAGAHVNHRDREVRAAALRAMGRLGRVPMRARTAVVIALSDDTEFVRAQAARAAAFVPARLAVMALRRALGDQSWWVRRAAAESLLRQNKWGVAVLRKAARSHPDHFASDMAAQVLLDAGILEALDAPASRRMA